MGNGSETAGDDNRRDSEVFGPTGDSLIPAKEVRIIKGIALMMLIAASLPGLAVAAGSGAGPASFESSSDEQLTALAAQWDSLDTHQRRALLTEMKTRMARGGNAAPVLRIRTERRYGRIIRQPDGRVIRIETNVVRVQPVTPEILARVRSHGGFGTGFEHRVGLRHQTGGASAGELRKPGSGSSLEGAPALPVLRASEATP